MAALYLRKELYELIKKDESIFDFIQEGSLDGLWYWDMENPENKWMNPRFWEVLGYDPKEMPHQTSTLQDIINQEDLQLVINNFNKHVATQHDTFEQEVRYTHKNGSTVLVRCRGLAIRNTDGKAVRMLGALQDIREKAEQALKHSEARLAASQQMAKLGNFEHDFEKDTLWWSDELFVILGFEKADIPPNYETFLKSMHPVDAIKHKELVERSLQFGENYEMTFRYNLPNNIEKYIFVKAEVVYDDNNTPKGLKGTSQDVTERILAENEIRNQKDLFEMVINSVPSLIFWKDKDLNYLGCNTTFAKFARLEKPSDIIGKSDYEMIWGAEAKKYRIDDRQIIESSIEKINYEESVMDHNGNYRLLQTNKMPLKNSKDETIGVIATCEDITERKRADETINVFFEQPMNIHLVSTIDGEILRINEGWVDILGYSKQEIIGRNILEFIHQDDIDSTVSELKDLEGGKRTFYFENRYKHKNGHYVTLAWSAIYDPSGNLLHAVAKDITQQKVYHEQLVKSEARYKA